jgi:hypothetical protein
LFALGKLRLSWFDRTCRTGFGPSSKPVREGEFCVAGLSI